MIITSFNDNNDNDFYQEPTPVVNYIPESIDEYLVIVNLPEDWEVVHNYIINENEIDGIPNRKIECINQKNYSLRSSVYKMSIEESEILKTHEKVESVELNPAKYPQPVSSDASRFGNNVAFPRPIFTTIDTFNNAIPTASMTNNVRANWSQIAVNNLTSEPYHPYRNVGITTTDSIDSDIIYNFTGKDVDAVVLDSGVSVLHPEFIGSGGEYRVRDVILDGPYKIDPDFFDADSSNRLETVTIDGVNIGTRAKESVARAWWSTERANYAGHGYTIKITDASNSSNFKTFTITDNGGVLFLSGVLNRQSFSYNNTPVASGGTLPSTGAVTIEFTRTGSGTWNSAASYGPFPYNLTTSNDNPTSGTINEYNSNTIFLNRVDSNGTDRSSVFNSSSPYNIDVETAVTNGTRSAKFVNSSIPGGSHSGEFGDINANNFSNYTRIHAHSKNGTNPIEDGHGTACASQIGGKYHGLAFECNLWNVRISLGDAGGFISSVLALDFCTLFHKAKKIASNDPDPTILNCSFANTLQTGNTKNTTYYHTFRTTNTSYVGTGTATDGSNFYNLIPSNSGACRNHKWMIFTNSANSYFYVRRYLSDKNHGGYYLNTAATSISSAAEDAISEGCIVLAGAANDAQKLSDKTDVDFDNKYYGQNSDSGDEDYNSNASSYSGGSFTNRVGGVQQGFSGDHDIGKGTIRVGGIDCGVEAVDAATKQGTEKYSIRKVSYSNDGPMIDIFAPAEATMAAGYANYESTIVSYQRGDNSSFYDYAFSGTSAACPNACAVVSLYLQQVRATKNQSQIRTWLTTTASKTGFLSDPISGVNDTGYFSVNVNTTFDLSSFGDQSLNVRGNGNLRGAPNRILFNPFAQTDSEEPFKINASNTNVLKLRGSLIIK